MTFPRRAILAGTVLAATTTDVLPAGAQAPGPRARVSTEMGSFVVEVDPTRAPISAADFLSYVSKGLLDNQSVYRIVTMANQPDTVSSKIEVVQFGWLGRTPNEPPPLPAIAHEPTSVTGLKHLDGTLSMARFAPGTASAGFFICIGPQPSLDFGGGRNPDGQGFAAFGQVVEGMDVVRNIFARGEASDRLTQRIAITSATLL